MRRFLDNFLFLKNGYSVLAHVLPLGVASLLLLALSVPQDNLLLKLVESLKRPEMWIPAAFLTIISTSVYAISVYVQVRKAYLFQRGIKIRTAGTCLLFTVLCSLMAYVVLKSASPSALTPTGIWGCFLVAVLSLTGVGWSTPTQWIDALGVKCPDYEEAQRLVHLLTNTLNSIRARPRSSKDDVIRVLSYGGNLQTELEKNVDREPDWARQNIVPPGNALRDFVGAVADTFSNAEDQVIEDFAQVVNCRKQFQYGAVVNALRTVSGFWHEWQCGVNRGG